MTIDKKIEKLEKWYCPKRHQVAFTTTNYDKDWSEGLIDADGLPMYEDGLYCMDCQKIYGISKYETPK
ncbi:hypothetical protein J4418_02170 [Candidatus Woesearchaeota archaeon]|nr:hypothetical protein [Candidatus Woesearchaeota archaeon]